MTMTVHELAGTYSHAWGQRDVPAITALHTDDSVFHVHGAFAAAHGREAVRGAVAAMLALVPDLSFAPRRVHVGREHFVSEYVMSGTARGVPFSVDGVDVIAVSDGLVARKDTYLDLAAADVITGLQ